LYFYQAFKHHGSSAKVTCTFLVLRNIGKIHRIKLFSSHKNNCYNFHIFIFKDTFVNQALPSLHGSSLKIALTVPFNMLNKSASHFFEETTVENNQFLAIGKQESLIHP